MNQTDRLERDLTAWLVETAAPRTPDFLDDILAQTAGSGQRPAWSFPERWLPMRVMTFRAAPRPLPWRTMGVLVVLVLLVAAAAAVYVGSQPRLPAPFGVARNGLTAYSKAGDIFTLDPEGSGPRAIVTGSTNDHDPVWSLDGTRIAFLRATDGGETLLMADADGSHQVLAKTGPLVDSNTVAWSPDGRSIAVTSSIDNRRTITKIDSSTGDVRVLDVGMSAEEVSWRPPDGRGLVFLGESATGMGLYLVAPDGSSPTEIVHADSDTGLLPNGWSPDGRRLAFHRLEQIAPGMSVYRIHVLDLDTRAEVVIASSGGDRNNAGFGKWSPDGSRIVFLDGGDDCNCNWLSVAPSSGGPGTKITGEYPAPYGIGYAWSPDGTTVYTEPVSGGGISLLDPTSGTATRPPWVADGLSSWQRQAR
jgi:dipeptidyl aminopeptidase/acylaminoacyl peptidase